jgi:hypothetical protein
MKWHFGTTIVIAMHMDPTSQKEIHNDQAHGHFSEQHRQNLRTHESNI